MSVPTDGQPLTPQACLDKRNHFKESLDEIGSKIREHVAAKGSREQLLIHFDYLTSCFEKSLSWHAKAVSCSGIQNNNFRLIVGQWVAKLNADYSDYRNVANSYLAISEQAPLASPPSDTGLELSVARVPQFLDPTNSLNTDPRQTLQAGTGQAQSAGGSTMTRRHSLLSKKRADSWIVGQGQSSISNSSLPGRLPKMELPKLYGDPKEWLKFAAAFNTLVHSNSNDNAYRMAMLQQSLSPSVQESISVFLVAPECYPEALSELRSIYGDPILIAQTYLDELASLKAVPDGDPVALRTFSYKLGAIFAGLVNEDFHQDLSASTTLSLLASKLPARLRSKWTKRVMKLQDQNVRPDIEHFMDCLKVIAELESRNSNLRILPARDFPDTKKPRLDIPQEKGKSPAPKARSYAISFSNPPTGQCLACDGAHDSLSCDLYTNLSLDDRVAKVREKKACFRCLSRSHTCSDCPCKDPCGVDSCKKAHHPSIHVLRRILAGVRLLKDYRKG